MQTQLNTILSLPIVSVIEIHDYLQIFFSNGAILNLFNKYSYKANDSRICSLVGSFVTQLTQNQQNICISFSNGSELIIGLSYDDYNGPEALELIRKGEKPIVL
jgi:hypothetical protein